MDKLNDLLTSYKYPLLAGLVGIVLLFSGSITSLFAQPQTKNVELPPESLVTETSEKLKVDIAGAVLKPGVHELHKDNRIEDLIKAAGGFSPDVNPEYISKYLNLSQKISDSQKLYIPFAGEKLPVGLTTQPQTISTEISSKTSLAQNKVNINTASQSEIEELSGIGPSTASKIIAGRPFQSINELQTKKIVGKATFEKIKDQIEI